MPIYDPEKAARQLEKAFEQISGQIAGLSAIIALLPETRRLERSKVKQRAAQRLRDYAVQQEADKLIDALVPAIPEKANPKAAPKSLL